MTSLCSSFAKCTSRSHPQGSFVDILSQWDIWLSGGNVYELTNAVNSGKTWGYFLGYLRWGRAKGKIFQVGKCETILVFYVKTHHFACLQVKTLIWSQGTGYRNQLQEVGSSRPLPCGNPWLVMAVWRLTRNMPCFDATAHDRKPTRVSFKNQVMQLKKT